MLEIRPIVEENNSFRLSIKPSSEQIQIELLELETGFKLIDGPYLYKVEQVVGEEKRISERLLSIQVLTGNHSIILNGQLGNLQLKHHLHLPAIGAWLDETILICNNSSEVICLSDFCCGMRRKLTDEVGKILPELRSDRFRAVPFFHRADHPGDFDQDFDLDYILAHTGREVVVVKDRAVYADGHGYFPANKHVSEGWAWRHIDRHFGIFKFNQEALEFSVLAIDPLQEGAFLRFGGTCFVSGEPSVLYSIQPGQRIQLGTTRYTTRFGGYEQISYAFRSFLDENGCRFPPDFNPPVHWNELYDNSEFGLETPGKPPGARFTRQKTYTKDLILEEAKKADDYSCEALYLDPGWDTDFATFYWGEVWLGNRGEFINEIREKYGLGLSLHAPLATWLSHDGGSVSQWPNESFRTGERGEIIKGSICLGARQYLDEAEKRLIAHCADGVRFLMFDGNWFSGDCRNQDHGHLVPYTKEAHIRANMDLAQRIHSHYPDVLIEMHDMVTGGCDVRYTPVYYKYGLPGSYDENWGFELMWQPVEDIRKGNARALYYYNLGCNIPVYLHIDLREDNQHCLALWWFASTCRHLGIGGSHESPIVADAQKQAMNRYRDLEAFYKRGEFYGLGEEVHLHVLPQENAFVVNLFNLSDESRLIGGKVKVADLGLDPDRWYCPTKGGIFDPNSGSFSIERRLEPWSAQVAKVEALI